MDKKNFKKFTQTLFSGEKRKEFREGGAICDVIRACE
jgi:hypothetical protein